MLSAGAVLNEQTLASILASGHSRIPVHRAGARYGCAALRLFNALPAWDAQSSAICTRWLSRSCENMPAQEGHCWARSGQGAHHDQHRAPACGKHPCGQEIPRPVRNVSARPCLLHMLHLHASHSTLW